MFHRKKSTPASLASRPSVSFSLAFESRDSHIIISRFLSSLFALPLSSLLSDSSFRVLLHSSLFSQLHGRRSLSSSSPLLAPCLLHAPLISICASPLLHWQSSTRAKWDSEARAAALFALLFASLLRVVCRQRLLPPRLSFFFFFPPSLSSTSLSLSRILVLQP